MPKTGHGSSCGPPSKKKKSADVTATPIDVTTYTNMNSHLAALPGEIVSNVVGRLGSDDLFAVRLTCRDLEAKSRHDFATEYFSRKAFVFTTDSLKVLLHIAESEKLRKYLRGVQFITAYFPERQIECSNGCDCLAAPTVRQKEAYKGYMADQQQLKASGDDKKLLAKSFRLLHKLEGIEIVDTFGMVPKTVDIRGFNKIQRVTGLPPTTPSDGDTDKQYRTWLLHIWKAVVVALAHQPVPSLQEFKMLARTAINGLGISDLSLNDKTITGLRPTFSQVKSLNLSIRGQKKDGVLSLPSLVKFGSLFSSLEDLRLSFDYFQPALLTNVKLLGIADLSKLTRLRIDGLHATSQSLSSLLAGAKAIVELFLVWVNLTDGSWVEILEVLEKLEHLKHLHLQWLSQASRKAYFLKQFEAGNENADHEGNGRPRNPNRQPSAAANTTDTDDWADDDDDDDDEGSDDIPDLIDGVDMVDGREDSAHERDSLSGVGDGGAGNAAAAAVDDDDDLEDEDELDALYDDDYDDYYDSELDDGEAYPLRTEQHFQAPGHEDYDERGYYVCIHDDDIAKYLPIFIDEFNVGQNPNRSTASDADILAAAMGPPPAVPLARGAGHHPANADGNGPHNVAALADGMMMGVARLLRRGGGPMPPFPLRYM